MTGLESKRNNPSSWSAFCTRPSCIITYISRAHARTHLATKNTVDKIIRNKEQVLSGLLRELIEKTQVTRNEDCYICCS